MIIEGHNSVHFAFMIPQKLEEEKVDNLKLSSAEYLSKKNVAWLFLHNLSTLPNSLSPKFRS